MNAVLVSHTIAGGKETYILKFKDKPDRMGYRIYNEDFKTIKLQEIIIQKMVGENNKIQIDLLHSISND